MDVSSSSSTPSKAAPTAPGTKKSAAVKTAPKKASPAADSAAAGAVPAKAPRVRKATKSAASSGGETPSSTPQVPEEYATEKPLPAALSGMIATAAYYLAVQRNFEPGHEVEDWLEAERQIRAFYG